MKLNLLLPPRLLAPLGVVATLAFMPSSPHQHAPPAQTVTSSGPTSCLDIPVSNAIVHPTACWVTGPTSIVVAGTSAQSSRDGEVVLVDEQTRRAAILPGAGVLRIDGVESGRVCLSAASGATRAVDIATGDVGASCAGPPVPTAHQQFGARSRSSAADFVTRAPQATSSFYVYGSYVDVCGLTATEGCPLYNDGAGEAVPSTGGMTVLDFGAPCFEPATLAWGTQMFNSASCTPDTTLAVLAQAWLRGFATNPNHSASQRYILVAGASNSLTAASPGNALNPAQQSAHGRAWFTSVVRPTVAAAGRLPTPVTIWSGNDIEQSSDGNWYGGPATNAWVDGYSAASGATKPCLSGRQGLMVDYGDYVPNQPGWSAAAVYHAAWGAPAACPMPEIYYTANAGVWDGLNQWARGAGLPDMQFTAVLSEDGAAESLSAAGSWNALWNVTGQPAPYLSAIGLAGSVGAEVPDPPTAIAALPGATSATVSWAAPAWDGGARITRYTVMAYAQGKAEQVVTVGGWPTAQTAIVRGLTNGSAYTFMVSATNAVGTGPQSLPSRPVTPGELLPFSAVITAQHQLNGSDGRTWTDIAGQALSLTLKPTVTARAFITATADLSTDTAGVNQDMAIDVNGKVAAWKESSGAVADSPNAVNLETVYRVTAGTTYTVKLRWKTNVAAPAATIYAGAGLLNGQFSPTQLALRLVPDAAGLTSVAITSQPSLSDSDGTTWAVIDPALELGWRAPDTGTAFVSGNADLWMQDAAHNQDLGIAVNGVVSAWTESGGSTSPNAAEVQAVIPVTSGTQYAIALRWKAGRAAPGVVMHAGAGPIGGQFSPTRLTVRFVPAGTSIATSRSQYTLQASDGVTWHAIDASTFAVPASGNCLAVLSAHADLSTTAAGSHPQLAIAVATLDAIAYPGGIVGWRDTGGAAAGSPSGVFVQAIVALPAGQSYTARLLWKSGAPSTSSLIAGAGGGPFSPTTLTAELTCF